MKRAFQSVKSTEIDNQHENRKNVKNKFLKITNENVQKVTNSFPYMFPIV